jgi:hypothetical protein
MGSPARLYLRNGSDKANSTDLNLGVDRSVCVSGLAAPQTVIGNSSKFPGLYSDSR